jgi:hypothetical protein
MAIVRVTTRRGEIVPFTALDTTNALVALVKSEIHDAAVTGIRKIEIDFEKEEDK